MVYWWCVGRLRGCCHNGSTGLLTTNNFVYCRINPTHSSMSTSAVSSRLPQSVLPVNISQGTKYLHTFECEYVWAEGCSRLTQLLGGRFNRLMLPNLHVFTMLQYINNGGNNKINALIFGIIIFLTSQFPLCSGILKFC